MKLKEIILGSLIFLAIACSNKAPVYKNSDQRLEQEYELTTVIYEGCEYVSGWKGDSRGGPIFTHKGNCLNPDHGMKTNMPIREDVIRTNLDIPAVSIDIPDTIPTIRTTKPFAISNVISDGDVVYLLFGDNQSIGPLIIKKK